MFPAVVGVASVLSRAVAVLEDPPIASLVSLSSPAAISLSAPQLLAVAVLALAAAGAAWVFACRRMRVGFWRVLGRAQGQIWEAIVERRADGLHWKFTFFGRSALYEDLFGPERMDPHHPWGDVVRPEQEAMDRRSREAIDSGAPGYSQEFPIERRGVTRWLQEHVTIHPLGAQRWSLVGVIADVTAMHVAQDQLREHGRMVVQTLARADCLLWRAVVRAEGQEVRWVRFDMPESGLYARLFGHGDRGGRTLWSLLDVPDLPAMNARSTRAILSGASGYEQEFHAFRGETLFWLHEQVSIAPAGGGEFHLVGVIMDVTALRTAEEARKATEAQIEHLLARADCLLWQARVFRTDGPELRWVLYVPNSSLHRRLFGADPAGAPNLPWERIVSPEQARSMYHRAREAILSGASSYEQEIHAVNGGHQFMLHERVNVQSINENEWYLVGTVFDVTALHLAETALAAEKERLSVTLAAMSDAVLTTDRAGRVLFANRALGQLLGEDPERLVGRMAAEVCRLTDEPGRPVQVPIEEVLTKDASVLFPPRVRMLGGGGVRAAIEGAIAPVHDPRGGIVGAVAVMRDVTARERLEEEMSRASRLQSVGLLAGGIAHDFNNLLTVILGNVVVLKQTFPYEGEVAACLGEAERAVLRARDLTQQLLTFARGGDPVRSAVQLQDIITEAAAFGARGSAARCEFDLPPDLWLADADRGQIAQVVQNLVLNAVQAMPQGGFVRITARNEHIDAGSAPVDAGDYIRITVEDSGCGIPPEDLGRIYDPYFTTKSQGSGLGLATVYSIVRKHRGAIEVTSQPGAGTIFRLLLPAAHAGEPPRDATAPRNAGMLNGRILLMDDEEAIRKVAGRMLSRLGLAVETAADGAAAVELFRSARERGEPFDVVMLDLTIPGGMGGMETLRKLRDFDPGVRAVVSSGYSDEMAMGDHRAHGFVGVIPKPYQLDDCARVLGAVLRQSAGG